MKAVINNKIIIVDRLEPFWENEKSVDFLVKTIGAKKTCNILFFLAFILVGQSTVLKIRDILNQIRIKNNITDNKNCPICLQGTLNNINCMSCQTKHEKILETILDIISELKNHDIEEHDPNENACPICQTVMTDRFKCSHCQADLERFFRCPYKNHDDNCNINKNNCTYKALEYENCNVFHEQTD